MEYDFIVIGAGIAGASIAYELARRARVCLSQGEARPGYHSTGPFGRPVRAVLRRSRNSRADPREPRFFRCDRRPASASSRCCCPAVACTSHATDQRERLAEMVREIRANPAATSRCSTRRAARKCVPLLRPGYVGGGGAGHRRHGHRRRRAAPGIPARRARGGRDDRDQLPRDQGRSAATANWSSTLPRRHRPRTHARSMPPAHGPTKSPRSCGAEPVGLQPLRRTAVLVGRAERRRHQDVARRHRRRRAVLLQAGGRQAAAFARRRNGRRRRATCKPTNSTSPSPSTACRPRWTSRCTASAIAGPACARSHPTASPVVGYDPRVPGLVLVRRPGRVRHPVGTGLARTAAALAQRQLVAAGCPRMKA